MATRQRAGVRKRMPASKRVAARKRLPASKAARAKKRAVTKKKTAKRALPLSRSYTPELIAHVRHRYENTPEQVVHMAADLGIHPTSVHRLAKNHDWIRRNLQPKGMPTALQILQEAQAAEASGDRETPESRAATIDRLERAVRNELAAVEAMRAALGPLPQKPIDAERTVRTLGLLTQTMQHLQRLRAGEMLAANSANGAMTDYDDMPADIDEFREALARKIESFMESRTDEEAFRPDVDAAAGEA